MNKLIKILGITTLLTLVPISLKLLVEDNMNKYQPTITCSQNINSNYQITK